ncbi:hypothetical protein MHU86_18792 [Fragilaria crotonensis]|nr:hypothetical protein MHU86_18792 [Fragilaria crotonensis]
MRPKNHLLVPFIFNVILSLVYSLYVSENIWSASRQTDSGFAASENVPPAGQTIMLKTANVREMETRKANQPQASITQQTLTSDVPFDKILVVYSGPTDLMDLNIRPEEISDAHKKMELYRLNFEFFLRSGIHCQTHDTLIVVTYVVKSKYQTQIDELHDKCRANYGNYVRLITRNNTCLDLDSVRVAIEYTGQGNRPAVVTNRSTTSTKIDATSAYYDYFVYINCGVTGPSSQWANRPWTSVFLEKLRDGVKMVGLTINCYFQENPHAQSMMYALDREGLQVVVDGGAIYDCTKRPGYFGIDVEALQDKIVSGYELELSKLILQAGYGISSVVRPITLFRHNQTQCLNKYGNDTLNDVWLGETLVEYFGRVPSLDEVIFFKTSRILTPETADIINFTLEVDWNWI